MSQTSGDATGLGTVHLARVQPQSEKLPQRQTVSPRYHPIWLIR
jgi:hypothetical protein